MSAEAYSRGRDGLFCERPATSGSVGLPIENERRPPRQSNGSMASGMIVKDTVGFASIKSFDCSIETE